MLSPRAFTSVSTPLNVTLPADPAPPPVMFQAAEASSLVSESSPAAPENATGTGRGPSTVRLPEPEPPVIDTAVVDAIGRLLSTPLTIREISAPVAEIDTVLTPSARFVTHGSGGARGPPPEPAPIEVSEVVPIGASSVSVAVTVAATPSADDRSSVPAGFALCPAAAPALVAPPSAGSTEGSPLSVDTAVGADVTAVVSETVAVTSVEGVEVDSVEPGEPSSVTVCVTLGSAATGGGSVGVAPEFCSDRVGPDCTWAAGVLAIDAKAGLDTVPDVAAALVEADGVPPGGIVTWCAWALAGDCPRSETELNRATRTDPKALNVRVSG